MISGIAEPNVLIVSDGNKRISSNLGRHYTDLGAMVMIANIELQENRLIIENFNDMGIRYASICRTVCDKNEASKVLHNYLYECKKFTVVINLTREESVEKSRLLDMVDPEGGFIYTYVMSCDKSPSYEE